MSTQELACNEFVELVTNYLEGALSPADRSRFERHLAGCAGCESYLEQMRSTIRLVGRLHEETIPAQARDEMLNIFRDWKTEQGIE